jgi:methylmalonyl-CoA mutase C-terminal domain/subunit
LSGAHMTLFRDVTKLLKEKGMGDVLVVGGGIIPAEDVPALKKAGIAGCFGPGTSCEDIVEFIKKNVKR